MFEHGEARGVEDNGAGAAGWCKPRVVWREAQMGEFLTIVFPLLGGVGLFLVGMMLLSQGLTEFAGDSLRRALMHFTGTPAKAFGSGAMVTLMVQSSTATTITLIGFVSAGLIPFGQAVGVVLGASLGTTGTGWLVAGLGLKVDFAFFTLPLIGLGALMRLLAPRRWGALGLALAGFGTLFVGLGQMQEGMATLSRDFDFSMLPTGGLLAHLLVLLIGVVLTTLLQSSTAAVAMALTALHTGTVNLEQAAAWVIGAAIGTTLTGALAAVGGTTSAKRTAAAHIIFNLSTGIIALLLLPGFLWVIDELQARVGLAPGALSLAAFHTLFIGVGVLLFLPWIGAYARAIERALPERASPLVRYLDDSLLGVPSVALVAVDRGLAGLGVRLFEIERDLLRGETSGDDPRLREAADALGEFQAFSARIAPVGDSPVLLAQRLAQMHALDHAQRLINRLRQPLLSETARLHPVCRKALLVSESMLNRAGSGLAATEPSDTAWVNEVEGRSGELAQVLQQARTDLLRESGRGDRQVSDALRVTDTLRWLDRVGHHVWRLSFYVDHARRCAQDDTAERADGAGHEPLGGARGGGEAGAAPGVGGPPDPTGSAARPGESGFRESGEASDSSSPSSRATDDR